MKKMLVKHTSPYSHGGNPNLGCSGTCANMGVAPSRYRGPVAHKAKLPGCILQSRADALLARGYCSSISTRYVQGAVTAVRPGK